MTGDREGVCAVVLAAGKGQRMRAGGIATPKHAIEVRTQAGVAPMLVHVLRALARSRATRTVVVLAPEDAIGEELARGAGAAICHADPPDEGRAASIRSGVRAAPEAAGWLFALADQPFLEPSDFDRLISALGDASPPRAAGARRIVHATYAGQRGSPVLFGSGHRAALLALSGAQGGRAVLAAHPECAVPVPLDPARGLDLDTPADLPESG